MNRLRSGDGRFSATPIPLESTRELGYLSGLILGDGSLFKTKTRNYRIDVKSTKKELPDLFGRAVKKYCLQLNVLRYSYNLTRTFPNGVTRTDMTYGAYINSKNLYSLLRSCKKGNSYWVIPPFLLEKVDALVGFLQGLYDAEGGVSKAKNPNHHQVFLCSKHSVNLQQVKECLKPLGINATIYQVGKGREHYQLRIFKKQSKIRFAHLIGFRLREKEQKMMEYVKYFAEGKNA